MAWDMGLDGRWVRPLDSPPLVSASRYCCRIRLNLILQIPNLILQILNSILQIPNSILQIPNSILRSRDRIWE